MPYLNVAEVESGLQVAAQPPYAGFAQLIAVPHLTWEGRAAHALKLAAGSAAGRPGMLLLGGVHAREWGSSDILLFFVGQTRPHAIVLSHPPSPGSSPRLRASRTETSAHKRG